MFTQVKLFQLLRAYWPLESYGFVLAKAVRVFLLFRICPAPCGRTSFGAGLSLLSCLFDLLLFRLLSGVAESAPLIHFCVPLALFILPGETPRSLFLALPGRRLLQFRHNDQVFTS